VTESELILSLWKKKDLGIAGSDEESIRKFREIYKNQLDLVALATRGDPKALTQLRWVLGLKVIT
jgi:hypothetical protein